MTAQASQRSPRASPSISGPVVVDATGEIFGDVPNIAARAQALAEPGAVVVTARVQRQIAGLFVAEERGSHDLKGVPEPVTLFRIVRASGGGRRAGQRHLTPLVGRDEEIAMLLRRWERARQGDGQLVLIVGEPGLGKSRLIEEFHARLREVPHTWVEWSCSQLLQNTPLHPIAEWGRNGSAALTILREAQDTIVARGLLGHEQEFLDSLHVMETGMRHFFVKAMSAKANNGKPEIVDANMLQAVSIAEKIAPYRHARLSAMKLAGDQNSPVRFKDDASAAELREEIMKRLEILTSAGLIDLEALPAPKRKIAN